MTRKTTNPDQSPSTESGPAFGRRAFLGAAAAGLMAAGAARIERPNILWIVSEDNSAHWLGCYGDAVARTPRLDALAREGVRFTRCFANAPVCAPARNTLHTGIHAHSLGCEHMRSNQPLPEGIRFFTNHLREAGYFCVNGDKTDYNVDSTPQGAWDARDQRLAWRLAPPRRPFFAFINLMTTHESSLHRDFEPKTDPASVRLSPRHPDIPEMRRDYARYYDRLELMDRQVGVILDRLQRDGRAEDTIVFYFSDNGGILPGSKRCLNDRGTHVPLIVRAPEKWRGLLPGAPGEVCDRVVSHVDFAPSVLALAGLNAPPVMQGHAFLGPEEARAGGPEYAHCFTGRMDTLYDCGRSVHDRHFNYIRNYLPHRPAGRLLDYLWKMPSMRAYEREWRAGRLNPLQASFFLPKPAEELYDLENDPYETVNLAGHPDHHETLVRMRGENLRFLRAIGDRGLIPEAEMVRRAAGRSPRAISDYDLETTLTAAERTGRGDGEAPAMIAGLKHQESAVRYWSAAGLAGVSAAALKDAEPALRPALTDPSPSVRTAAAEALHRIDPAPARATLVTLLFDRELFTALAAVDTLAAVGEVFGDEEEQRAKSVKRALTLSVAAGVLR